MIFVTSVSSSFLQLTIITITHECHLLQAAEHGQSDQLLLGAAEDARGDERREEGQLQPADHLVLPLHQALQQKDRCGANAQVQGGPVPEPEHDRLGVRVLRSGLRGHQERGRHVLGGRLAGGSARPLLPVPARPARRSLRPQGAQQQLQELLEEQVQLVQVGSTSSPRTTTT